MKKIASILLIAIISAFSLMAVPPGCYYDYNGNMKAIVSDNGQTIYLLDKEGQVKHELQVTQENQDGSFAVYDTKTGISHSDNKNAWFYSNGNVCLNVEWLPSTVTRK